MANTVYGPSESIFASQITWNVKLHNKGKGFSYRNTGSGYLEYIIKQDLRGKLSSYVKSTHVSLSCCGILLLNFCGACNWFNICKDS